MLGQELSPQDTLKALETNPQAILLDVREKEEWNEIHSPRAILLPLSELNPETLNLKLQKTDEIYVICRSGGRSGRATQIMLQLGYQSVTNVKGGMNLWEEQNLPVVSEA